MKVKLITLFICVLFLWAKFIGLQCSKLIPPPTHQIKIATENVNVQLHQRSELEVIIFTLHSNNTCKLCIRKAYLWQQRILNIHLPFHKSVRAYISVQDLTELDRGHVAAFSSCLLARFFLLSFSILLNS